MWAPRLSSSPGAARWWTAPFALAVVAALAGGILDWRGLAILLVLGAACHTARTSTVPALNAAAHALMFALTAGLFVHALPGFANPRVLEGVRLAPDSLPYTKYLNFDKGAAGPAPARPLRAVADGTPRPHGRRAECSGASR